MRTTHLAMHVVIAILICGYSSACATSGGQRGNQPAAAIFESPQDGLLLRIAFDKDNGDLPFRYGTFQTE